MGSRSKRGKVILKRSYPFSKAVMQTIAQLILVFIAVPILLVILDALIPDSAENAFFNMLGEIPMVSVIFDFVNALPSAELPPDQLFFSYSALIPKVGSYVFELFFVAFSIIIAEEIDEMLSFNKGAPIIAIVLGALYGSVVCALVKAANAPIFVKVVFILLMFGVSVMFMVLNKVFTSPRPNKIPRVILVRYFTAGIQALVGSYTIFWGCCILVIASYGFQFFINLGFQAWGVFVRLFLLPTIAEIGFMALDLLFYLAAKGIKD